MAKEENGQDPYPELSQAISEAVKNLIEETDKAGFQNPDLDCQIETEDGRVFRFNFERVK